MNIIFFGLGSIGQRHAKILQEHFDHNLYAFRSNKNLPNDLGIKEVYSWEEVDSIRPEIAFITNPTFLHIETAKKCAELGMHMFIEKPLSDQYEGIDDLEKICEKKKLTVYVAYCLRFHPLIEKMAELLEGKDLYHARISCTSFLPDWRKGADVKKSYSSLKKMGGGVICDLSHEFDYIDYLFGEIKSMHASIGRAANITVDAEDFADVIFECEKGLHVNLHLNFLSLITERTIKVDFCNGYITGDLATNELTYGHDGKEEVFRFDLERNDYFKKQLEYFFENIKNSGLMNNLKDSKRLLERIVEARNG